MPDWADTPGELLTLLLIVGSVAGGVRWILRQLDQRIAAVAERLDERTAPIQSTTNGNSINARVNLIIQRQIEIADELQAVRSDIGDVHGRVTEHINWHLDHTEGNRRTRATD